MPQLLKFMSIISSSIKLIIYAGSRHSCHIPNKHSVKNVSAISIYCTEAKERSHMDRTEEDAPFLLMVSLPLNLFLPVSTRQKRLLLLNVITSLRKKFKENCRWLRGKIGECCAGGNLANHGKFFLCYSIPCILLHSACISIKHKNRK